MRLFFDRLIQARLEAVDLGMDEVLLSFEGYLEVLTFGGVRTVFSSHPCFIARLFKRWKFGNVHEAPDMVIGN